jgi:hypothetical protein
MLEGTLIKYQFDDFWNFRQIAGINELNNFRADKIEKVSLVGRFGKHSVNREHLNNGYICVVFGAKVLKFEVNLQKLFGNI